MRANVRSLSRFYIPCININNISLFSIIRNQRTNPGKNQFTHRAYSNNNDHPTSPPRTTSSRTSDERPSDENVYDEASPTQPHNPMPMYAVVNKTSACEDTSTKSSGATPFYAVVNDTATDEDDTANSTQPSNPMPAYAAVNKTSTSGANMTSKRPTVQPYAYTDCLISPPNNRPISGHRPTVVVDGGMSSRDDQPGWVDNNLYAKSEEPEYAHVGTDNAAYAYATFEGKDGNDAVGSKEPVNADVGAENAAYAYATFERKDGNDAVLNEHDEGVGWAENTIYVTSSP